MGEFVLPGLFDVLMFYYHLAEVFMLVPPHPRSVALLVGLAVGHVFQRCFAHKTLEFEFEFEFEYRFIRAGA